MYASGCGFRPHAPVRESPFSSISSPERGGDFSLQIKVSLEAAWLLTKQEKDIIMEMINAVKGTKAGCASCRELPPAERQHSPPVISPPRAVRLNRSGTVGLNGFSRHRDVRSRRSQSGRIRAKKSGTAEYMDVLRLFPADLRMKETFLYIPFRNRAAEIIRLFRGMIAMYTK